MTSRRAGAYRFSNLRRTFRSWLDPAGERNIYRRLLKRIGPGATGCHLDLEDIASIRAALTEGPTINHLVIMPLYSLATSVKDFNVTEANRLLHIKLTGYIDSVGTCCHA